MRSIKVGQAATGLVFILLGVLLWLDRAGMIEIHGIWQLWPGVFLISLGASRILQARAGLRGGLWSPSVPRRSA